MELSLFSLLSVGFFGGVVWFFNKQKYGRLVLWLSSVSVLLFALGDFDTNGKILLSGLICFLSLSWLLAHFLSFTPKVVGGFLFALFLLAMYFIVDLTVEFNGYETAVINKFTVFSLVLGCFSFFLWDFLFNFSKKMNLEEEKATKVFQFILPSVGLFLASFGASEIGLILGMTPFVIGAFLDKKGIIAGVFSIFMTFIALITVRLELEAIQLNHPDVLMALVLGGAFGGLFSSIKKRKIGTALLLTLILFAVSIAITNAGDIFELTGGVDAFIAFSFGLGIALVCFNRLVLATSLPFLLFVVVSFLTLEDVEEQTREVQELDKTEEVRIPVIKEISIPLDSLSGEYVFIPKHSKVNFDVLGKSITKGAFKEIEGSLNAEEKTVEVEMKMENFTTFSGYRDDELRGNDYFKSEKFPVLNYRVHSIKSRQNDLYGEGEMTMIGVTRPLDVVMNLVEIDSKIILKGSGKLNRTDYGMSPSSTEGNEVKFMFEVEVESFYQK